MILCPDTFSDNSNLTCSVSGNAPLGRFSMVIRDHLSQFLSLFMPYQLSALMSPSVSLSWGLLWFPYRVPAFSQVAFPIDGIFLVYTEMQFNVLTIVNVAVSWQDLNFSWLVSL